MTFGEFCKQKREALGLKQIDLAKTVNCQSQHIGNIERGERYPSLVLTFKLAKVFKLDPRKLYYDCLLEQMPSDEEHFAPLYTPPTDADLQKQLESRGYTVWKGDPPDYKTISLDDLGGEYQKIPYFEPDTLKVAAGSGFLIDENSKHSEHPVVLFPGKGHPGCFAIRVDGNSMEPTVYSDDIVVICPGEIKRGEVGLFHLAEYSEYPSIVLKRLGQVKNDTIVLLSDNQIEHSPIILPAEEVTPVGYLEGIAWRGMR